MHPLLVATVFYPCYRRRGRFSCLVTVVAELWLTGCLYSVSLLKLAFFCWILFAILPFFSIKWRKATQAKKKKFPHVIRSRGHWADVHCSRTHCLLGQRRKKHAWVRARYKSRSTYVAQHSGLFIVNSTPRRPLTADLLLSASTVSQRGAYPFGETMLTALFIAGTQSNCGGWTRWRAVSPILVYVLLEV